jgi:succinate-acetate transporter protein
MAEYVADTQQVGAESTSAPGDPVALSTFATTTVILGCVFTGFIAPVLGAGLSFFAAVAFFGGLVLLMLGLRSSATLYAAYGGFLMTLGAVFVPSFGMASSASSMLGLFFLTWTIFTGMFLLSTLRSSLSTVLIHLLFFLAFLSLTIGELAGGMAVWLSIGGWLAIVCGLIAWYNAFVGLLSTDHSFFKLPAW